MSADSLQKKLNNAHKKVSLKLGYTYGLYRPIYNYEVLDDSNWLDDVKLTATLSDSYTSTIGWNIPVWMIYTSAALTQEGDFLYSEEQGRTFFIISQLPHLPVLALEVNDRANIYTVGYADTATGYQPGVTTPVMSNLPVCVAQGASVEGPLIAQASVAASGNRQFELITTYPQPDELLNKYVSLFDSTFTGTVVSYSKSPLGKGVKFTVKEQD